LFPTIIILLFGVVSVWYLFLKPWDFQLYFTLKTQPGVVYQGIQDWREWNGKIINEKKIKVSEKKPWEHLKTQLELNDTTLIFNWDITRKNDSITRVKVKVTDNERKIYNRLTVPFQKTPFKKSIKENVLQLRKKIDEQAKSFRFKFIDTNSFSEVTCVTISIKSTVRKKADEMIKNVIELNMFVKDNNLGLNGNPMVFIKNWNPANDTIQFDFCFPINHPEIMPEHPGIKLKSVSMPKALKGEFYGNYSISDMAWYPLFEEAQKTGVKTTGQILEVYHNDPHSGGNDLEWKAVIYMGIED
jgi:effector-binding domain-containing protein